MANADIIKCVALFYKLRAAPKDFVHKEKFCIKLPPLLAQIAAAERAERATSVGVGLFIDIVIIHKIVICNRLTVLQFCHSLTTYNSAK